MSYRFWRSGEGFVLGSVKRQVTKIDLQGHDAHGCTHHPPPITVVACCGIPAALCRPLLALLFDKQLLHSFVPAISGLLRKLKNPQARVILEIVIRVTVLTQNQFRLILDRIRLWVYLSVCYVALLSSVKEERSKMLQWMKSARGQGDCVEAVED